MLSNEPIISLDILGEIPCKVIIYMGHNSEIAKMLTSQKNGSCVNISLGCGLEGGNVVRKKSLNGAYMAKTLGKPEFWSAMENRLSPADYEDRGNPDADYKKIRKFLDMQYPNQDFFYKDYSATVYWYIIAHIKMGQKHAMELAKNKRCKCDCPDGINLSVKVLDGMRIIYDDDDAKGFPTLEMIGNIKRNYPCE